MLTANLTLKEIIGDIQSGVKFTVNAHSLVQGNSTASAIVVFNKPANVPHSALKILSYQPSIGSISVGGQNNYLFTTEIIKVTYWVGQYNYATGTFSTGTATTQSSQASEKDGTVSSSHTFSGTNGNTNATTYPAFQILVESTQSLVGCAVTMSNFGLKIDYRPTVFIATVETANASNGDVAYLTDANYTTNKGLSGEYSISSDPKAYPVYAKAGTGSKITKIGIKYYGDKKFQNGAQYLKESGKLNEEQTILKYAFTNYFIPSFVSENELDAYDSIDKFYQSVKVYFEREPYTFKISSDNAKNGDYIQIFNADKTQALGTEVTLYSEGESIYWKAEASPGRRIAGITHKRNGEVLWSLFGDDLHGTFGNAIDDKRTVVEETSSYNDITRGNVNEYIIHFEDAYTVYLGQTKALRAYLGQTEILKIV